MRLTGTLHGELQKSADIATQTAGDIGGIVGGRLAAAGGNVFAINLHDDVTRADARLGGGHAFVGAAEDTAVRAFAPNDGTSDAGILARGHRSKLIAL